MSSNPCDWLSGKSYVTGPLKCRIAISSTAVSTDGTSIAATIHSFFFRSWSYLARASIVSDSSCPCCELSGPLQSSLTGVDAKSRLTWLACKKSKPKMTGDTRLSTTANVWFTLHLPAMQTLASAK